MRTAQLVIYLLCTVVSLLGLIIAARARDDYTALIGWVFCLAGIFCVFFSIKRHFDARDASGH